VKKINTKCQMIPKIQKSNTIIPDSTQIVMHPSTIFVYNQHLLVIRAGHNHLLFCFLVNLCKVPWCKYRQHAYKIHVEGLIKSP
jgi:hypothetical protein